MSVFTTVLQPVTILKQLLFNAVCRREDPGWVDEDSTAPVSDVAQFRDIEMNGNLKSQISFEQSNSFGQHVQPSPCQILAKNNNVLFHQYLSVLSDFQSTAMYGIN